MSAKIAKDRIFDAEGVLVAGADAPVSDEVARAYPDQVTTSADDQPEQTSEREQATKTRVARNTTRSQ